MNDSKYEVGTTDDYGTMKLNVKILEGRITVWTKDRKTGEELWVDIDSQGRIMVNTGYTKCNLTPIVENQGKNFMKIRFKSDGDKE